MKLLIILFILSIVITIVTEKNQIMILVVGALIALVIEAIEWIFDKIKSWK